jgi:hypothetical protein
MYREAVNKKIKNENAPLFTNHKPLKITDPKKNIKFITQYQTLENFLSNWRCMEISVSLESLNKKY